MKTRGVIAMLLALVFAAPAAASPRPLTAKDRRQINHALDVFVNHAVKRKNPVAAYDVVTQTMKNGMTRKEWAQGWIPVYPFPDARGSTFHGWTVDYRQGNELGVELILMPVHRQTVESIAYDISLDKIRGRWLVNSAMTAATFAPEGKRARVVGTFDFTPGTPSDTSSPEQSPGVNPDYALIPFFALGLFALALVALGLVSAYRYRTGRSALPPFPGRLRSRA